MAGLKSKGRVLVLEAVARAAVEVVRSFLRHGLDVYAAADRRWCAAFYVRGLRHRLRYPSVIDAPERFIEWLLDYLRSRPVETVLPLGDVGTELVARHQEEIRNHARLFIPPYDVFWVAHDKIKTNKAAVAVGVPVPRSWYPEEEGLDVVLREGSYPLIVKPSVGVGARGIVRVNSPGELERVWAAVHKSGRRVFVQEHIPLTGRQFVVDVLLDEKGRDVAVVASEKVRFFPVRGGASTLSRSLHCDHLCELTVKLLRSFGYYGVANVDYIEDPRDGVIKLLEINPRFGEMHAICAASGVDLAWLYYRLARGDDVDAVKRYQANRYLQFLPTDAMRFLRSSDRFRTKPAFVECFNRDVHHTLFAGSDFGPMMGYVLENIALLARPGQFLYRFWR